MSAQRPDSWDARDRLNEIVGQRRCPVSRGAFLGFCGLCNEAPEAHLTNAEWGYAIAQLTDPERPPRDEVRIQLPREAWESVLASMTWPLPNVDAPGEVAYVQHSEHCFLAQDAIRAGLRGGA